MVSIYRRFDGDILPNASLNDHGQTKSMDRGQMKNFGKMARYPQPFGQPQRYMQQGADVKNMGARPKALPAPKEEGEPHQTKNHQRSKKPKGFLEGILPSAIYDPRSKKLFGVLASEDLLLIALIFLLLEKEGEDNKLMVVALLYVLLSDYIDLSELGF